MNLTGLGDTTIAMPMLELLTRSVNYGSAILTILVITQGCSVTRSLKLEIRYEETQTKQTCEQEDVPERSKTSEEEQWTSPGNTSPTSMMHDMLQTGKRLPEHRRQIDVQQRTNVDRTAYAGSLRPMRWVQAETPKGLGCPVCARRQDAR